MQTYIKQLLTDLQAAQTRQPVKPDYKVLYPDHPANDPMYKGVMDYMIEWENAPEWKMDDLFEIKGEAFPPAEKLSEAQAEQLVHQILELWSSFNLQAEVWDDDIPIKLVYTVLVNFWKTETVQYVSVGTLHLEFCSYELESCPWGEQYCSCKEFENEDWNTSNNKTPRLLFNADDLNSNDDDIDSDLPF